MNLLAELLSKGWQELESFEPGDGSFTKTYVKPPSTTYYTSIEAAWAAERRGDA